MLVSTRGNRGFSIIETLVAMGLLLFMMGGMYLLVENGMRYFRLGYAFQSAQQQALVGMHKICDELQNSRRDAGPGGTLDGASLTPPAPSATPHLIFPSARPSYPNGNDPLSRDLNSTSPTFLSFQWQKWVCYYLSPLPDLTAVPPVLYGDLIRAEKPIGTPFSVPLSQSWDIGTNPNPALAVMTAVTGPQKAVVARKISKLLFRPETNNHELYITLAAAEDTASDKQTVVELRERITLLATQP